jgi:hypothetical protein
MSQFASFFRKEGIRMSPKSAASVLSPRPDRARSDFFLFSYLKEKLHGISLTTGGGLSLEAEPIFSEIPEMVLKNVFINWTTKLTWITKNGGKYCTN